MHVDRAGMPSRAKEKWFILSHNYYQFLQEHIQIFNIFATYIEELLTNEAVLDHCRLSFNTVMKGKLNFDNLIITTRFFSTIISSHL